MEKKTCEACIAGILITPKFGPRGYGIERCDHCLLFGSDADAIALIRSFLESLHAEYRGVNSDDTIADAFTRLVRR